MLVSLKALKKFKYKMKLEKGIYLTPKLYEFNFHILLHLSKTPYKNPMLEVGGKKRFAFGVCDNFEQILERFPQILTSKEKYIIALTEVRRGIEGQPFGWRWHKWGRYIGTQNRQATYLYDEPEITKVYTFSIYEILN